MSTYDVPGAALCPGTPREALGKAEHKQGDQQINNNVLGYDVIRKQMCAAKDAYTEYHQR